MIFSRAVPVGKVEFPEFTGLQVHMRHITISKVREAGSDIFVARYEGVPESYIVVVDRMLHDAYDDYKRINGANPYGHLYLTIDEREIPAGDTHRRGGVHYDGAYFVTLEKDPRWNTVNHSGVTQGAGLILAASHVGSQGWRGTLLGTAGPGGDCEHMRSQLSELEQFDLEAGVIYHGNATFVHESVPVVEATRRQLVRLTYSK